MFTALTLFFAAIGVILLAKYPLIGAMVLLGVSWPVLKLAGVRDEEAFMAALMIGAAAGALVEFATFLLQRL